jgi:hypothetical protein
MSARGHAKRLSGRAGAVTLAAAAALALLAGCASPSEPIDRNRCDETEECATGTCDRARGWCVSDPEQPVSIALEVVPESEPLGGTPLAVTFAPVELAGSAELDLALPVGVSVRGRVRWIGEPVTASVAFVLPREIPGRPPTRVETQTFNTPMRDGAEVFDYAVQLLPSRVYDVFVEPNGAWRARLPPLQFRFESPPEGARSVQAFDYPEALPRVRGRVVSAEGAGEPGLLVRAIDPLTGRALSSTAETTAGPGDAQGQFEVVFAPGPERWVFSINASASRLEAGLASPTFTVDPRALVDGPEGVTILLPSIARETILYEGVVELEGRPGVGAAASLSWSARDVLDDATGVVGAYRVTAATTDEPGLEGVFSVRLLPGTYEVVVTPTSPELGIARTRVRLDPVGVDRVVGQVFPVAERARFGGRVQVPWGAPVEGARVRAIARASSLAGVLDDVAVYARSSEGASDGLGQFLLGLDVGLFDVVVEPPEGSGWPWSVRTDLAVGTVEGVFGDVFELSAPLVISGRAAFEEYDAPARAEVRAYQLLEGPDGPRTVEVGRARTDAEGRYTLLLPSRIR